MSSPPTDEEIAVARAVVQSFQTDAAPGASVNHTNNPFLFGLVGQFDALKMSARIIKALDGHRDSVSRAKAQLAAELAKSPNKTATSVQE